MRILWLVALVGIVAGPAAADTLTATRGQALSETAHRVELAIVDGVATYTVRRTFKNTGSQADQVELELQLPSGAAATGLRIRARDRWYTGDLMERDQAAEIYRELTGFGPHGAKDPALLSWMWVDRLALQVFPVLPGHSSTVEYTLTAPTRYEHGRYLVAYPRGVAVGGRDRASLPLATPTLTVRARAGAVVDVDGKRVAAGAAVALTAPSQPAWAAQVAADPAASYVASAIAVPAANRTAGTVTEVTVDLAIAHTYRGDLRIELVTPSDEVVMIQDQVSGHANDVRGRFVVALREPTPAAGTWRLVVSDHVRLDSGVLERWSITLGREAPMTVASADTPQFIPDAPEQAGDGGVATIGVALPATAPWVARFGDVVASSAHAFARLEVDVAPALSSAPRHAQVVFVVDASYSQRDEGVEAQRALIRTYLGHVPDAEVEVVVYRRHAVRAFGRFVPARDLDRALASATAAFALGNGSALDEGAALAVQLLAGRPGPQRVVLVTDELVRASLTPAVALASLAGLGGDAVVHVVAPRLDHDSVPSLTRRDDAELAPLATRHHGIFVELAGLPMVKPPLWAPVVLELVRPTRIEQLTALGFTLDQPVLREGSSLRLFEKAASVASSTRLTGVLWSDPISLEVHASPAFSRSAAAFVFGADEHGELSPAEQMTVALAGGAVSPVTSYVAAEPGTRPSTIGFVQPSTFGVGRYGTIGHGYGSGTGLSPSFAGKIDPAPCEAAVRPPRGWRVALEIDTTREEIVDVRATAADDDAMARCLIEATWALRLDAAFAAHPRDQFAVVLVGQAAR